jgi:hypothetical protein
LCNSELEGLLVIWHHGLEVFVFEELVKKITGVGHVLRHAVSHVPANIPTVNTGGPADRMLVCVPFRMFFRQIKLPRSLSWHAMYMIR